MSYNKQYATFTEYKGIKMELVGQWIDLAAYYKGSDGNYWAYQSKFVNQGPSIGNKRGKTIKGEAITTLPKLN